MSRLGCHVRVQEWESPAERVRSLVLCFKAHVLRERVSLTTHTRRTPAHFRANYKLSVAILGSPPPGGARRQVRALRVVAGASHGSQPVAARHSNAADHRQGESKSQPGDRADAEEPGPGSAQGDCTWGAGWEALGVYTTCLTCLAAVFVLRSTVCYTIEHCRGKVVPDALLFPAWEGPVLMTQLLALTDAGLAAVSTRCTSLWVIVGYCFLIVGPAGFLVGAFFRILYHRRAGNLVYEKADRLNFSVVCADLSHKGVVGKVRSLWASYTVWITGGEWKVDNQHARHWAFVVGAYLRLGSELQSVGRDRNKNHSLIEQS